MGGSRATVSYVVEDTGPEFVKHSGPGDGLGAPAPRLPGPPPLGRASYPWLRTGCSGLGL